MNCFFESNQAKTEDVLQSIVSLGNKPTIHDLIQLHVEARGEIVDNKEDADIVVSLDGDLTPYDVDTINADYMS